MLHTLSPRAIVDTRRMLTDKNDVYLRACSRAHSVYVRVRVDGVVSRRFGSVAFYVFVRVSPHRPPRRCGPRVCV